MLSPEAEVMLVRRVFKADQTCLWGQAPEMTKLDEHVKHRKVTEVISPVRRSYDAHAESVKPHLGRSLVLDGSNRLKDLGTPPPRRTLLIPRVGNGEQSRYFLVQRCNSVPPFCDRMEGVRQSLLTNALLHETTILQETVRLQAFEQGHVPASSGCRRRCR